MQNRRAVILPLGMMLEKVDISSFIVKMLAQAKKENPNFVFDATKQKEAYGLSHQFNLGKLIPSAFMNQLLAVLEIKTMQEKEFWQEWNNMVTVGDIQQQIKNLQDICFAEPVSFYLVSDTNAPHLDKIAKACNKDNEEPVLDCMHKPMLLEYFRLYASYQYGMNHEDLLNKVLQDVKFKAFNKPTTITLLLGDPNNIDNPMQREVIKQQNAKTIAWCEKKNVAVCLHNNANTLAQTFEKLFQPEKQELTKRSRCSML